MAIITVQINADMELLAKMLEKLQEQEFIKIKEGYNYYGLARLFIRWEADEAINEELYR